MAKQFITRWWNEDDSSGRDMIKSNEEKVKDAIAYLRSRDKYLLDGCKWVPTPPDKTDVKKTIEDYREAVK